MSNLSGKPMFQALQKAEKYFGDIYNLLKKNQKRKLPIQLIVQISEVQNFEIDKPLQVKLMTQILKEFNKAKEGSQPRTNSFESQPLRKPAPFQMLSPPRNIKTPKKKIVNQPQYI